MRILTPLALAALTISITPAVHAEEDLFSEVAVEAVFSGSPKAKAAGSGSASAGSTATSRVTGAGQLGKLLRSAGLETERVDGKAVSLAVSHGEWSIPTTVRAAVERGQIDIVMGLATPKKDTKWSSGKLLNLLASASDTAGAYFAYDRSLGQIQLRQTVSARDVTGVRLSALLTEMAEFAVSREDSWFKKAAKGEAGTTVAAPAPLVGTYVANLAAGEAFALSLTKQGTFALAHVKAGKTTTSKGKLERTADQMKLVGEKGTAIAGTVSNLTTEGFDWVLTGGRKLTFKKSGK